MRQVRTATALQRLTSIPAPSNLALMLRVGTDLVSVADVRDAVACHGDRYLRRVFDPRELADCAGDHARLAARFAAKEAVIKVLRPQDEAVPWDQIRVRRHDAGWVDVELRDAALSLARRAGLGELALSLTHDGDCAAATAVGWTAP